MKLVTIAIFAAFTATASAQTAPVRPSESELPAIQVKPTRIIIPAAPVCPSESELPAVQVKPTRIIVPAAPVRPSESELPVIQAKPVKNENKN